MGVFSRVSTYKPGRSLFNLSYEKKFTCDMGELIPILADEMVPGDIWSIGAQSVIRIQPMVAPVLHEIDVTCHYFFVPYRILWDGWEDFITGGEDGNNADSLPTFELTHADQMHKGTLWDYLGFPDIGGLTFDAWPLAFPFYAYTRIYNEYYRAQEIIDEVDETTNTDILYRAWEKDYFTSALLEQQRGTAPSLPISGTTSAVWAANINMQAKWDPATGNNAQNLVGDSNESQPYDIHTHNTLENNAITLSKTDLDANTVDLSGATTFDIADLRLATQMQKVLERNNRAGARYTEWLHSHYAVSPRDDRLQRPEYIGGLKFPLIVSEVLQTSQTGTTAQGNMAGHGVGGVRQFAGKYRAQEFGVVMGIMSIMPKPVYQQGINRQWNSLCKQTKWDFYLPELAHISEQAILRSEIYAVQTNVPNADNDAIFGYQGRYDEMRYKPSMVCSGMRDTFDYWHISRQFTTWPELNETFIATSSTSPRKDFLAAPSEDAFIVSWGNVIKAFRPLPVSSDPGLMDH